MSNNQMTLVQTNLTAPTDDTSILVPQELQHLPNKERPNNYKYLASLLLYGAIAFTGGFAFAGLEDYRTNGSAFTALTQVVK